MKSRFSAALCGLACMAAVGGIYRPAAADIDQIQQDFQAPPDDARIMVRYWWFGPGVTQATIDHDLNAMKAGGIGGFEVQPTYPLAVNGVAANGANNTNVKFLSPQFLSLLGYTANKAKALGLRMDLTLGSGWPYGGPMFSGATTTAAGGESAGTRRSSVTTLSAANITAGSVAVPSGLGGSVIAISGLNGTDATSAVSLPISGGTVSTSGLVAGQKIYFSGYLMHSSGIGVPNVKRPAYGASGPVIDHLSSSIVDKFIKEVAEVEIKACGRNVPFSVFCDSLEVTGENWTENFFSEFQSRRGYDLTLHMPALVDAVDRTNDIRYDWGRTVTDIFNDNFNTKFTNLAHKYGSRFRIQGYGSPPAALYSYNYSDLPEGEGGGSGLWHGSFTALRYAASASHLMGQKLASSETFTWLHDAPFRATPPDIKAEVDTHFLSGINQIDCHGWPGMVAALPYPGTSFYAAAVFNDQNPWYIAMPEVSRYMQRVSQMMREGTPANDIALYFNDADIFAGATVSGGFSSMNSAYTNQGSMLGTILDAGYNLDGWDDGMLALRGSVDTATGTLAFGNVKYPIVVLNAPTRMPLATAQKLQTFADNGGLVVLIGSTVPTVVPGFAASAADQASLATIMAHIFTDSGHTGIETTAANFKADLNARLKPDFSAASATIGCVHRHGVGGEIYFIANNSNTPTGSFNATFRQGTGSPELWDPLTGKIRPLSVVSQSGGTTTVSLNLDAYGSTVVVFTNRTLPTTTPGTPPATIDITSNWPVTFSPSSSNEDPAHRVLASPLVTNMPTLTDWRNVAGLAQYSGVASYQKTVNLSAADAAYGFVLTFDAPTTGVYGIQGSGNNGVHADIKPSVLDAAVVYVNGVRAGAAWTAPYQVDLKGYLQAGDNVIRIDVGNTAINYLNTAVTNTNESPSTPNLFPNYNDVAVSAVYGNNFDPQNTSHYTLSLPSGILGSVKLVASPP